MPAKPSVGVAVAVLASVAEAPRHPYQIWATMRERGHDALLGISSTAVYDAVRRLSGDARLEVLDRNRVGQWPERTIYRVTAAGVAWLRDAVGRLLAEPGGDPAQFEVGLSFMFALGRDEVIDQLHARVAAISQLIEAATDELAAANALGVPALFVCEQEHRLMLLRGELEWAKMLIAQLHDDASIWPSRDDSRSNGEAKAEET